jgi:hypothetical protein
MHIQAVLYKCALKLNSNLFASDIQAVLYMCALKLNSNLFASEKSILVLQTTLLPPAIVCIIVSVLFLSGHLTYVFFQ